MTAGEEQKQSKGREKGKLLMLSNPGPGLARRNYTYQTNQRSLRDRKMAKLLYNRSLGFGCHPFAKLSAGFSKDVQQSRGGHKEGQ